MLKARIVRMLVGAVFDQLSLSTLEMIKESVDAELLERRSQHG